MIDLVQEFGNIIHEDFHYAQNGNILRLVEKNKSAKGAYVDLEIPNIKVFVLELDKRKIIEKKPNPKEKDITSDIHILLKDGQEDLKKACDYLVFCQKQDSLFMLMVELKSNNTKRWTRQTKAGEAVAKYLLGMLENYKKYCFLEKISFRHILFSTKNTDSSTENTDSPKGKNKSKIREMQEVKYEQDTIFQFLFCRKTANEEYDLGIFLQ